MAKYRFSSDSNFANFIGDVEDLGADETVLRKDELELTVEIDDNWVAELPLIDFPHIVQLWGGERDDW